MKKLFLIKKNRFLVNLRHFYNIYLNIVKILFLVEKTFFVTDLGGLLLRYLQQNRSYSCPERSSVFRWETGVGISGFGRTITPPHAEIYHKDDQMAHSSRNPTDPGFSELLGTSLGMPLIVLDKY